MSQTNKQTLGSSGEEAASRYLTSKGIRILKRNFQKRYGEIDIIAMDGKTLVFVEVRTRTGDKFGTPEESITPWKMKSLVRSAQFFMKLYPDLGEAMRIDMVSVEFSSEGAIENITHYENISG